MRGDARAHGA